MYASILNFDLSITALNIRVKIIFYGGFVKSHSAMSKLSAKLQCQAVGNQFPEVFHGKIFHAVFFFDAVKLSMTAMAGDNYHFGTCRPDLLHLLFTVKDSFRVVPCCERAASASAAQLVLFCRIKIDPVLHALVKDPPRFIIISVTEYIFGLSAVIAGIMICGRNLEF